MNTRTKPAEPRLRVLISGSLFGPNTTSAPSGWPAEVVLVPDHCTPHAAEPWMEALAAAAVQVDAVVCLLVHDAGNHTENTTPDWPARLTDTLATWRHQWRTEPFMVRCLCMNSLAQAGAFSDLLLRPTTGLLTGMDARVQRALQCCQPDETWQMDQYWGRWQRWDGHTRRWGLGTRSLANSMGYTTALTDRARVLYLSDTCGVLCTLSVVPGTTTRRRLNAQILAWLRQQRKATRALAGSMCVTSDLLRAH